MDPNNQTIITSSFESALSKRFLQYAMSTITSRSLPDVRDGLKPVHRRLLYAMSLLKLNPENSFKKSARVVGDVMGKFHPHGDSAIYDAMVRLAQEFSMRYKLVEGQGNFGNIDGDNAAAMRYTEVKLSLLSKHMLEGIDQDAVDFRDTYDGGGVEPILLPSAFPNLLVNGAQGIAVGMASSIPPHNFYEILNAAILLINNPNATQDDLSKIVLGPDFPTGGILCETIDSISKSYIDGRGNFKLRGSWKKETLKSGKWQICINEIPYQVQKSKLIEKIAELIETKKIPDFLNIKDESSDLIRIIIEPRSKNSAPEDLMETLFYFTDLETNYSLNINVLDENGLPKVFSLKDAINSWLNHRKQVLKRISKFNLEKILSRILVLESYLVVFANLDLILKIIREEENPKDELIKKLKLENSQAESILEMKLRNLKKLEEQKINSEKNKLLDEKNNILKLLSDEDLQWKEIKNQIEKLKKLFTNFFVRKTKLNYNFKKNNSPLITKINSEEITISISNMGWINLYKGHNIDKNKIKFKEGDYQKFLLQTFSDSNLMIFASNGKLYTINAQKLINIKENGEPLSLLFDDLHDQEIINFIEYKKDLKCLLISSSGRGLITNLNNILTYRKSGKQLLLINKEEKLKVCIEVNGNMIAIIGENKKLIVFPSKEIPILFRGRGVILQRYKNSFCDRAIFFNSHEGIIFTNENGRKRFERNYSQWLAKRGSIGKIYNRKFN